MAGLLSCVTTRLVVLLSLCATSGLAQSGPTTLGQGDLWNSTTEEEPEHHSSEGVHLAALNWDYVKQPLVITAFILIVGIIKIGFHHFHFLSAAIPESCLLIAIGVAYSAGLYFNEDEMGSYRLEYRTFMLFLLPPIVLDAAYSLDHRAFSDNIITILLYAVVGTVINFVIIGFALWGFYCAGWMGHGFEITMIQCLLFGSLIVAVDPVAVLAIFQEIHVNPSLYFLVFGESLLNDAVTIVISNMMKAFSDTPTITDSDIIIGVFSFFTISLGALGIGVVIGIIITLVTRVTFGVRVVEPLVLLFGAYMAYLCAELVHWSGIISAVGCGLVESHYAFHNISDKSRITVVYFMKMLSQTCDSIIFCFLGLELIRSDHEWNTGFALWTLLLCLVARVVSVFGLTFLVNIGNHVNPIILREQFIMWYGGLRGAIAFAVCTTLSSDLPVKSIFLTTTFFIIFFTVFVQGITIKPIVKFCHIKRQSADKEPLLISVQNQLNDTLLPLVEVLIGQRGKNFIRAWIYNFNEKYVKRVLQGKRHETQTDKIVRLYKEAAIKYYESVMLVHAGAHMEAGVIVMSQDIEQALISELPNGMSSPSSTVRGSRKSDDTDELRRILTQSTMWLYDRDLRHDDHNANNDALAGLAAVTSLHNTYLHQLASSQHLIATRVQPPSDDDASSVGTTTLQQTMSVTSLTRALAAEEAQQTKPHLVRRYSESAASPSSHKKEAKKAKVARSRRFVRHRTSSNRETGKKPSKRLSTLGEEETVTAFDGRGLPDHEDADDRRPSSSDDDGSFVNPVMQQQQRNGHVVGAANPDKTEADEPSTML